MGCEGERLTSRDSRQSHELRVMMRVNPPGRRAGSSARATCRKVTSFSVFRGLESRSVGTSLNGPSSLLLSDLLITNL
jgi:hypothetical protein